MYTLLDRKTDVKSFLVNDNIQLLASINKVFDLSGKILLESAISLQELKTTNNSIFINASNGNSYLFDNGFRQNQFFIQYLYYPFCLSYVRENDEKNAVIYDLRNLEIVTKRKGSSTIFYFYNEYFIKDFGSINENIIQCFTSKESIPKWEFSLSELGLCFDPLRNTNTGYTVCRFLGVWQSELIVALNKYLIISLDLETGEIKRKWYKVEGLNYPHGIGDRLPDSSNFILYGDKLVGTTLAYYIEIDLLTGNTSFFDLSDELKKYNIFSFKSINDNPIIDNKLYLTASMQNEKNTNKFSHDCLVILNIDTKKVEWQYSFEEASLNLNRPQVHGNKLYQLDANKTLHIFEKE